MLRKLIVGISAMMIRTRLFILLLSIWFIESKVKILKPSSSTPLASPEEHHVPKILAFWNVFAMSGKNYDTIIREQMKIIRRSGLYDKLDAINYVTSGDKGYNLTLRDEEEIGHSKYVHVKHNGDRGSEALTLRVVADYCKVSNPKTKILYFHNKGSYHASEANHNFRNALDCFNLNPYCIEALDTYDTCGMRLAPYPHVHYSGNYWWSNCDHINKLLDPLSFLNNATILDYTNFVSKEGAVPLFHSATWEEAKARYGKVDSATMGAGRFFAETWIGSLPVFKPADCLSLSMDKKYFNGYDSIPTTTIEGVCPNVKETLRERNNQTSTRNATGKFSYGTTCSAAAFLTAKPNEIKSLVNDHYRIFGEKHLKKILDRSIYWYGQKPELVFKWLVQFKPDQVNRLNWQKATTESVDDLIDTK